MAIQQIISKATLTDYIGPFVAYTYADGHIETVPPNRPQSKEDVQRQRRIQVIRTRALAVLSSERAIVGTGNLPMVIKRENANTVGGKIMLSNYHDALHKLSEIAVTSTAFPGSIETLRTTIGLGGRVVGARSGQRPHYDKDDVPRYGGDETGVRSPIHPTRI